MSDVLRDLWDSTANLHQRFFGENPPLFEARWRVFVEEVGEFLFECSRTQVHASLNAHLPEPSKEGADVLVTIMGLLQGMYEGYGDFEKAVQSTIEKNDAKTLDTHEVRADGKIARRKV